MKQLYYRSTDFLCHKFIVALAQIWSGNAFPSISKILRTANTAPLKVPARGTEEVYSLS